MRLRELYQKISPTINELSLSFTRRSDNSYVITGVSSVVKAIKNIEETGLFYDAISSLRETKLFEGFTDNLIVNDHHLGLINKALEILKNSVAAFINSLEKANIDLEGNELSISIQLPNKFDFHELSKMFEQFKKAIELPVKEHPEGGEVRIKNFDTGSFWIDIILPSLASLYLVGRIVYSGVAIQNKRHQAKASEEYAAGLNTQSEWLNELRELGKKQIELLIETEAKLIEKESYNDHDEERIKRLQLAVKETSELISKGVTLTPSLAVPEEASKIFPDFNIKALIEPRTQKLEKGNN